MDSQLNITWNGEQGTLPDPVGYDISEADVLRIAQESIQSGSVPGIAADPDANLQDFVVQRFPAKDGLPNRIVIRPKTPFGCPV